MTADIIDLKSLANPFDEADIEWRVAQCGISAQNKPWAQVLAYVTSRAIQERLDFAVGPENWQNQFKDIAAGGIQCGIGIRCGDEWIWKWDGSDTTQIEATKGGLSGAMKRAGVHWGIGRYLYYLPQTWAQCSFDRGGIYENMTTTKDKKRIYWATPKLPVWALPGGSGKPLFGKDNA